MKRAAFALALALLVPARAVALCCLDASVGESPSTEEHGPMHHAQGPPAAEGQARIAADGGLECEPPEASAPALRERGQSDETRILFVTSTAPSSSLPTTEFVAREPLPAPPAAPPREIPHALRL